MTPEIVAKAKRYGEDAALKILNDQERERRAMALRIVERIRQMSNGTVTIQQLREALCPEGIALKSDQAYISARSRCGL